MPDTPENERTVDTLVAWVNEYWAAMVAVVRKQGWDEDDAKDIAQEAVVKALVIARREPERLDSVRSPCSWLCGIAWNMGRVALTKRQRREEILRRNGQRVLEELYQEPDQDRSSAAALPPSLSQAVDELLPPRQAEIVWLVLTEGMTDKELADRLKITVATVRWHRNEAIKALRHILRERELLPNANAE